MEAKNTTEKEPQSISALVPSNLAGSYGTNRGEIKHLTEAEIDSIRKQGMAAIEREIFLADQRKESAILSAEYFSKINGPRELWPSTLDSMMDMVSNRADQYIQQRTGNPDLKFDRQTDNEALLAICLYFLNDPAFEDIKPGYSLKKGLQLNGVTGCGKTMLMRLLQRNPKISYAMIDARKLADNYSQVGTKVIDKYSTFLKPKSINDAWEEQTDFGLCIDDLGTENISSSYGNKRNVLGDILLGRYANVPFNQTFITTNLNQSDILKTYDQRLLSRMKEMFNAVVFKARYDHRTKENVGVI